MHRPHPRPTGIAIELALLLALATLWGASYSFIKIGVATIPPVTLIAARPMTTRRANHFGLSENVSSPRTKNISVLQK